MKVSTKNRAIQWVMVASLAIAVVAFVGGCKSEKSGTGTGSGTSTTQKDVSKDAGTMADMAKDTATKAAETVAGTEQTLCPVMGKPINKDVYVEYEGKKVYFCCPDCKAKFLANPKDYLAKLPQFKQ